VAAYALASAALLVLARCRLAAVRRDRRPAEVVATARVLVMTARLSLLIAGVGALVVWLVIT
jgi:hypothetical protein